LQREKHDVVIFGSGPAALSLALFLNKHKVDVAVAITNPLKSFWKYDITQSAGVSDVINELGVHPILDTKKAVLQYKKNVAGTEYKEISDLYFKRYSEDSLDSSLFSKLIKASIPFYVVDDSFEISSVDGKNVKEITARLKSGDKLLFKSDVLVLAGGSEMRLPKNLRYTEKVFSRFYGEGIVTQGHLFDETRIVFDNNLFPGGYLYAGSTSDETFFCAVSSVGNPEFLKQYPSFLSTLFQESFEGDIKTIFSGVGVSGYRFSEYSNLFFIGGAAFLHDPIFGYGLNYALLSAHILSRAIVLDNFSLFTNFYEKTVSQFNDMLSFKSILRDPEEAELKKLFSLLSGEPVEDDKINSFYDLFLS